MRKLDVVLSGSDSVALSRESMRLQQAFVDAGYAFEINYQHGRFAQFFVEVNCCAEHFEAALRKLAFSVEVREDVLQATKMEECHDCQTISVAQ
jgi:hypothetical protein